MSLFIYFFVAHVTFVPDLKSAPPPPPPPPPPASVTHGWQNESEWTQANFQIYRQKK